MPAGVPVPEPVIKQDVEAVESARLGHPFRPSNVVYANVADDAYVLGSPTTSISYSTACIAREFKALARRSMMASARLSVLETKKEMKRESEHGGQTTFKSTSQASCRCACTRPTEAKPGT